MKTTINDTDHLLLTKYLLKETTPAEEQQAIQLLAASPGHQQYFNELSKVWEATLNVQVTSSTDTEQAWQRFQSRISESHSEAKQRSFPLFKIAASIIVLLGLALFIYKLSSKTPAADEITTSGTQVIIDTLPDQSIVTLNHQSSIKYSSKFNREGRNVKLEGEAFFNVTPDKNKPFIIDANEVQVKVVGTSFNVRTNADSTEIIVESGVVIVQNDSGEITLRQNEKVVVKNQVFQKTVQTDQLHNYYRTKMFTLDHTPLWKLVQVLNEAYNAKIRIENPVLAQEQMTSTFNNESLDQVLNVIRLTFNINIVKDSTGIILK